MNRFTHIALAIFYAAMIPISGLFYILIVMSYGSLVASDLDKQIQDIILEMSIVGPLTIVGCIAFLAFNPTIKSIMIKSLIYAYPVIHYSIIFALMLLQYVVS